MEHVPEECRALIDQADQYTAAGDHYNAVKLYKRAIRLAPDWIPPYHALGKLYKSRKEWKAVVYYHKKVVAIDPARQDNWWDLGIGAAAIGRMRLAQTVWNKFGLSPFQENHKRKVAVQLVHHGLYEVVGGLQLDPARVVLSSIPHPGSDRGYKDIILIDRDKVGTTVAGNKRWPIFRELDLLKRAHFQTWSCMLQDTAPHDIDLLEKLCTEANIGMEIWSNASRSMQVKGQTEFHAYPWRSERVSDQKMLVALAARRARPIREVLSNWKVISLKEWHSLERHR